MLIMWKDNLKYRTFEDPYFLVHDGQKYHKCDICGMAFSHAGDLKKHTE